MTCIYNARMNHGRRQHMDKRTTTPAVIRSANGTPDTASNCILLSLSLKPGLAKVIHKKAVHRVSPKGSFSRSIMKHPISKTAVSDQGKPVADSSTPASTPGSNGITFSPSQCMESPLPNRRIEAREFNELPNTDYHSKFGCNPSGTTNRADYRRALNDDADNRRRDSVVESTVYTNVTVRYPAPRFSGIKKGSK